MIDISCDLGDQPFKSIDRQTFMYRPIRKNIAGTGVGFAIACSNKFEKVNLLCKLSSDTFGKEILTLLDSKKVNVFYALDPEHPTGIVIKLNETTANQDIRLMIGSTISASENLTVCDVDKHYDVIKNSDLFVTDGYCVIKQPRRNATFRAMKIARDNKIPVVFDIVPHNAYELYEFSELKNILQFADIVITELGSIRKFLGILVPGEIYNEDLANETLKLLISEFEGKSFLLRYGNRNMCNHSLIYIPGYPVKHTYNAYTESNNKNGFGDRLAAQELFNYLNLIKERVITDSLIN